jgi:large subunit ribosomal protein L23
MKDYKTIIQSVVTEKSSKQQEKNQYAFVVKKDATKIDVKHAIKTIYGVDVDEVRTMRTPAKTRLIKRGQLWTKRPSYKKAIVTIKGGKTLDPNNFKKSKSDK